ncbi:tetratricopeptide repeat protein [Bdellovibrio bacteriovorus]|uniref:Adventurous gliding motility protein U n=1 Tax=Bdellovibrio bacteriovorus TaxID=959 RepID=A0A1Z3NC03_BDEBC|nr:tetratricopeptide repeat protein [Bdellovibrio bacteriovorus]ASD65003.1 hypothetical protein B9G79_16220 [Bdellovibrio bacteriovorus]
MKNLRRITLISIVVLGALNGRLALADKMNAGTQDLVIQKMERVLSAIGKEDPSWVPTQQRLADLLAERGRDRFMLEVEANCDGCKGSKADRQKAIGIYEELLRQVSLNEHGPILFQLAHLYEMAGQNDNAIRLFEQIIKEAKAKKINPAIVSRSHASLGDLLFQKNKFKDARYHYVIALKDDKLENRALVTYNMAWCDFNEDKLSSAITILETLLKNKHLITRDTEEGSKYDPVFHADIMRDLATFYSRKEINDKEIAQFESLAPAQNRKELLYHFASEADRLGQKQAAHKILNRYLEQPDLTKSERLSAFVRMAQVNYDRGQTTQSTQDFAKAAAAFKNTDCDDESKCEELQKTMKRYVTELHRLKKLNPDQDLLNAYVIYNKTFPTDIEMANRGSQIAMDMKKYPLAIQIYRSISESRKFSAKEREEALNNEVSAAEKSQDLNLRREAYLHYLKYSDNDAKSFEVRYQLAYLSYQQKQLKEAAVAFNDLAEDKKGSADLRKKAADLSLDAAAQLKDEESLQKWAWDYAKLFPAHRAEFETLARKALMNEVASVANNPKSSSSDMKKALKKVMSTDVATAKPAEKVLFYTNASVLAQKTGEDGIYIQSIQALIAMNEVSESRKDELREQLAAHYEKHLDFKNAYRMASQVRTPKVSEKDREFRLGTLADLAEMNPEKHYKAALKAGLKGERSLIMRSRLVLLSSNPVKELKAQAPELKQKPDLLNETALLVYARTMDKSGLKSVFEMKELRRKSAAQFFQKQDFYNKVANFHPKIASHQLNGKNDRTVQKSIQERMNLTAKADGMLKESLALKDITAQLIMLNIVASENERLVKDLASLPMPKGLSPAEQRQYVDLLKGRSKPYLLKARTAKQKMDELWAQSPALGQLAAEYKMARPEIQKLLLREMQILEDLPGRGRMKTAVSDALGSSSFSSRDLVSARKSVSENPSNVRDLENLKYLETKMGHPLMPSYLEARLNQIQKGKSL